MLRRKMVEAAAAPQLAERLTLLEAGERYIRHVDQLRGRKVSTVRNYQIMLRKHFAEFFGGRSLVAVDRKAVQAYQIAKRSESLSHKTIKKHVTFLHGLYRYAIGQEWASVNPVAGIEHLGDPNPTYDIRYLTIGEIHALIGAIPDDHLGELDRVLYLTAAMTGMRSGELQGLRWMDVDWHAQLIRVRRSYSFGEFTAPKSQRSSRAVPMAPEVAQALARHQQRSRWSDDEHLVFAHPLTGKPYDGSKILKRFKAGRPEGWPFS